MRRSGGDDGDLLRRAFAELARHADGVHELAHPAPVVDTALPASLRAFYRVADGAELFFGAIVVVPATAARIAGGRARLGEVEGDDLEIDVTTGAVWRRERDTSELLEEGTSFDRFLLGAIEAEMVIHDREGEFIGGIDAVGELEVETSIARERRRVKRDPSAPAPRWRLARALNRAGQVRAARDELEAVVEARPGFAWAWFDLARLAEAAGELAAARDDAAAAAEADPAHEHTPFFWAHAARLALKLGDPPAGRAAAERALAIDEGLGRSLRDGAEAQLHDGDLESAAELQALAAALMPRDLQVADLGRRIAQAAGDAPPTSVVLKPGSSGGGASRD